MILHETFQRKAQELSTAPLSHPRSLVALEPGLKSFPLAKACGFQPRPSKSEQMPLHRLATYRRVPAA